MKSISQLSDTSRRERKLIRRQRMKNRQFQDSLFTIKERCRDRYEGLKLEALCAVFMDSILKEDL